MVCHGCKERKLACHDTCPKYRAWKEEQEEKKKFLKRNGGFLINPYTQGKTNFSRASYAKGKGLMFI